MLVIAGSGLAYYVISPLFRNIEVQDALPENVIEEEKATTKTVTSGFENLSPERQKEMLALMNEVNAKESIEMDEVVPPLSEERSIFTSSVKGTTGHPAEGSVQVIQTTDGPVIRYENFKTINGPNLHVYIAKDLRADEFVDLGSIRGTSGSINYLVPADIDFSEYRYVLYWCVPFGVLFNYA